MESLKEVYLNIAEQDHVKEAQAQAVDQYGHDFSDVDPDLLKQAEDYDTIGRVMAHNAFADMVKEAVDEMYPQASEEDKKKETDKLVAKAKGEASGEDKKEEEDKDKKPPGEEGPEAEKKAAVRGAILRRMQEDPAYVSHLLSKYEIG